MKFFLAYTFTQIMLKSWGQRYIIIIYSYYFYFYYYIIIYLLIYHIKYDEIIGAIHNIIARHKDPLKMRYLRCVIIPDLIFKKMEKVFQKNKPTNKQNQYLLYIFSSSNI